MVLGDAEDKDREATEEDEGCSYTGRAKGKPRPYNCKYRLASNLVVLSSVRAHMSSRKLMPTLQGRPLQEEE